MPLILLSGLPSSGKTHRSEQLITNFSQRISTSSDPRTARLKIVHINDQSLGLNRSVYDAGRAEKDGRAAFASAVKRAVGQDTIVVADGMNYIKGYRYQLYCEAKQARTTSCVVQPATPPEVCRQLNEQSLQEGTGGYPTDQLENLMFRHEEPNGMNRWDSPLFVIPHDDSDPPYDAIWEGLIGAEGERKVVRPHAATVLKKPAEEGYLAHLERVCGDVLRQIEDRVKETGDTGGRMRVTGIAEDTEGEEVWLDLPVEGVRAPQLQRLRRQFVAMNRVNEVEKRRVGPLFVDYLNDTFSQ